MTKSITNEEILAWSNYPTPEGTSYYQNDLINDSKVSLLFGYCKNQEAVILAKGWKFLVDEYGLIGLLKLDEISAWIGEQGLGNKICGIVFQCLKAGFHPLINELGDYDESEQVFLLHDGSGKIKVDWDEIEALQHSLE